ncbi:MAG TPA: hypothetical protein VFA75_19525 [Nevskia sp.]|nr:hypothetical protein [Nevskia sp.]
MSAFWQKFRWTAPFDGFQTLIFILYAFVFLLTTGPLVPEVGPAGRFGLLALAYGLFCYVPLRRAVQERLQKAAAALVAFRDDHPGVVQRVALLVAFLGLMVGGWHVYRVATVPELRLVRLLGSIPPNGAFMSYDWHGDGRGGGTLLANFDFENQSGLNPPTATDALIQVEYDVDDLPHADLPAIAKKIVADAPLLQTGCAGRPKCRVLYVAAGSGVGRVVSTYGVLGVSGHDPFSFAAMLFGMFLVTMLLLRGLRNRDTALVAGVAGLGLIGLILSSEWTYTAFWQPLVGS